MMGVSELLLMLLSFPKAAACPPIVISDDKSVVKERTTLMSTMDKMTRGPNEIVAFLCIHNDKRGHNPSTDGPDGCTPPRTKVSPVER